MSSHEDRRGSEEVIGKPAFLSDVTVATEDHDFRPMSFEAPLHQLVGKPTQSVFVGNHNFRDIAALHPFQKGRKAPPFPVDSGSDVGDGGAVGFCASEVVDLALKVGFLSCAADSCVGGALTRRGGGGGGTGKNGLSERGSDAVDVVEPLPSWTGDALDLSPLRPSQSAVGHMVRRAHLACAHVRG